MYCKFCANEIDEDVIVCPKCGKQVKELKTTSNGSGTIDKLCADKSAWYFETWFIVLMFIVFFPIGIVLLILKKAQD